VLEVTYLQILHCRTTRSAHRTPRMLHARRALRQHTHRGCPVIQLIQLGFSMT
jgi:hypothetical protein